MKPNMGTIDKILRVLVAVLIIVLYSVDLISGLIATILLIFAAVFIGTSIFGFCPLYLPLKINTGKKTK
jgi:hypothetical protein